MPPSDVHGAPLPTLLEHALAAQEAFIDTRDLDAFLGAVAPLLRRAAQADLVIVGDVLWEMEGGGRIGSVFADAADGADIAGEAVQTLLRECGPLLQGGRTARLDGQGVRRAGLPAGRLEPVLQGERSVGFAYFSPPDAGRGFEIPVILRLTAQAIHLHRVFQGERTAYTAQSRSSVRWQRFANMLADALWEATPEGVIDPLVPLSDRLPDEARRSLQRDGMKALRLAGEIDIDEVFSHCDSCRQLPAYVVLSKESMPCWVSMQRLADGRILGALSVDQAAGGPYPKTTLVEMIERVERGRQREQRLRRQAETLLDGLRILTRAESSETFRDLLSLVRDAIHFDQACLVKRNWQGRLAAVGSTALALEAVGWPDLAPLLEGLGPHPVTLDNGHALCRRLEEVVRGPCNSVLVAPIHLAREYAWLICLHPLPNAFRSADVAMAQSLALLISQAMANQDQRNQVIQAAKLAALGQMVAGIAHEINQPLNGIALAAQNLEAMVERGSVDVSSAARKVGRILDQVARVHVITQKMRTFSRQSPGGREAFDPVEHIDNARSLLDAWLAQRDVRVKLVNPENAVPILGDPTQFEQVVANLLTNAADAILARRAQGAGDEAGLVTVGFSRLGQGEMEIVFRDNGTGFAEAALANALVPFFTTKEVGKGTGLGLSISYSIMANMGGGLRLGNWEGGAEVSLTAREASAPPESSSATGR